MSRAYVGVGSEDQGLTPIFPAQPSTWICLSRSLELAEH